MSSQGSLSEEGQKVEGKIKSRPSSWASFVHCPQIVGQLWQQRDERSVLNLANSLGIQSESV